MSLREKPEEVVRQRLILSMKEEFSFPKEMIAVERQIRSLPHLEGQKVPDRRFDIVVFGKDLVEGHPLYPLLIVECKKDSLTQGALNQVIGYNSYVRAFFIALASCDRVVLAWKDEGRYGYQFHEGLLPYQEMLRCSKRKTGLIVD